MSDRTDLIVRQPSPRTARKKKPTIHIAGIDYTVVTADGPDARYASSVRSVRMEDGREWMTGSTLFGRWRAPIAWLSTAEPTPEPPAVTLYDDRGRVRSTGTYQPDEVETAAHIAAICGIPVYEWHTTTPTGEQVHVVRIAPRRGITDTFVIKAEVNG